MPESQSSLHEALDALLEQYLERHGYCAPWFEPEFLDEVIALVRDDGSD